MAVADKPLSAGLINGRPIAARLERDIKRRRQEVLREVRTELREIELADGTRITTRVKVFPLLQGEGQSLVPIEGQKGGPSLWGTRRSKSIGGQRGSRAKAAKRRGA